MSSQRFSSALRLGGPLLLATVGAQSCVLDTIPEPLGPRPASDGATVVFDTAHRPLPEVPLPNDIATFTDPTSRTGLRVNASLHAASSLEVEAREAFAEQEGWGPSMPISVAFERTAAMNPTLPAIDLDELRRRTFRDEHRFDDDPVYLIDLETGLPVPLSFGSGEFPVTLHESDKYGPNDPHLRAHNLLFEELEEGAGRSQAEYRPELDLDFDGVLDHPNTWSASPPAEGSAPHFADQLLEVYERQTDTLLLRPLLPLREKREYAVVLTKRLRGQDGLPVRSPFEGVYHPAQRRFAERVQSILSDASRSNYYGDLAGRGLDDVTFLWGYTTAPIAEDLLLLRDGLYGKGPFAKLATRFPPRAQLLRAVGPGPGGDENSPACKARAGRPFAIATDDPSFRESVSEILDLLFSYGAGQTKALQEGLDGVDSLIVGEFDSPYLLGDPKHRKKDDRFKLDFRTGEGQISADKPQFWAAIPKPSGEHKQPYPVVVWAHGVGSNGVESILYGGDFARHGLATVTVQMPLHGLPDWSLVRLFLDAELKPLCLAPFTDAALKSRVLDLNGDGAGDVAHWWFTMHAATVRDNLRQAAVDYMQFTRVLRSFDGVTMSGQDYNGDGKEDLAGDFDGDGVVDFGGPTVPIYVGGGSNGGILASILGAVSHEYSATAIHAGGAGFADVASRSYGIAGAVMQALTPMFVAVPAQEKRPAGEASQTNCASGSSLRTIYSDGPNAAEIEIACLSESELHEGQTVVIHNFTNKEVRCARTGPEGRLRLAIPSSQGDRLRLQIYEGADRVESYKGCKLLPDSKLVRTVETFEQREVSARAVTADNPGCPDDASAGCTRIYERFIAVGSPLIAPQEGFGMLRQSPDLRRLFQLAQGLLDPADPLNFARHHLLEPLPDPHGNPGRPRPVMANASVGDGFVPVSGLQAFARAAGALPMFGPDAESLYPDYRDWVTPASLYGQYGKTPEQLLLETGVTEGNPYFTRYPVSREQCGSGQIASELCGTPPVPSDATCARTLYDVDWFSDGTDGFGAAHPQQPLRLVRRIDTDRNASPEQIWAPRTQASAGGFTGDSPLAALGHVYSAPTGTHMWLPPDACNLFDEATWANQLQSRFLASGGRDVYYVTRPEQHRCMATRSCTADGW